MKKSSKHTRIRDIISADNIGKTYTAKGWVRAFRSERFITLYDGSGSDTLQIVIDPETTPAETLTQISFHACIAATGKLIESPGSGQPVELVADTVTVLGSANPDEYPLQPKRQTMEFLREQAHLRLRTNTFSAVFRIRHTLAFAVHKFFHERGFYYMHTPIITGSDAEGAGEMFNVTTLPHNNAPTTGDGNVDYSQDFFGKETNLTVSGQLQAEAGALALGQVYTFGPTFRAENSNTSRHLAEFWMIEPEMAFADIHDDMDLAQDFIQYVIKYALEHNLPDLEMLDAKIAQAEKQMKAEDRRPMGLVESLRFVTDNDFKRLTYTEAIDLLLDSKPHKKGKFEFPVEWGIDLQSEHERWLVEKKFQQPVIVYDYPKDIKAFYMRMNDDNNTVAAMDVLFPGIGEIIGGSQREERHDVLHDRATAMGVDLDEIDWYMDLRKFGGCQHAGFGLGFERLVMFVTGMQNIRDVIPFARTPKNAGF